MAEATGIYTGDFIVQTGLRAGIADVRANPWLWPYVFAKLVDDPVTAQVYGPKLVAEMKAWIQKTDIPVFVNTRLDDIRMPAVTINLIENAEADNTLADKHYQTSEPAVDAVPWPDLTPKFTPVSWSSATGEMVLPDNIGPIYPGMNAVDRYGKMYPVTAVRTDDTNRLVVSVAPGTIADWKDMVFKSKDRPSVELESALDRDTYLIGCHVDGEPWQLTVLWSFIKFVLYRYRQAYFEARGFEVSSISSTDFSKNNAFDPEQVWSRYINLTGKTRCVWPKAVQQPVSGVDVGLKVIGGEHAPWPPDDALWVGDQDSIGTGTKR